MACKQGIKVLFVKRQRDFTKTKGAKTCFPRVPVLLCWNALSFFFIREEPAGLSRLPSSQFHSVEIKMFNASPMAQDWSVKLRFDLCE